MKRIQLIALAAAACGALSASTAYAWHLQGLVTCPNGGPLGGVWVRVVGTSESGPFDITAETGDDGSYFVGLDSTPGTYNAAIDPSTLPSDATVSSPSQPVAFSINNENDYIVTIDWVVDSPSVCGDACWFTGGGAKIDPLIDIHVATKGKLHSFGGNVNPGCSPTAGDGGNWNHVARGDIKLHFKGTSIRVVECGNVPGIPPGSTSPVTPFNYIKFEGTGTLKGIQGNKADYGTVRFFAYCEDRNEPGHDGDNDGALIDRYYLRVWNVASDGTEVVQLLVTGPASDYDPVPITDGNLQLHWRPCDSPPF